MKSSSHNIILHSKSNAILRCNILETNPRWYCKMKRKWWCCFYAQKGSRHVIQCNHLIIWQHLVHQMLATSIPEVIIFSKPWSPVLWDAQEVQFPASLPFLHWNKIRRGIIMWLCVCTFPFSHSWGAYIWWIIGLNPATKSKLKPTMAVLKKQKP